MRAPAVAPRRRDERGAATVLVLTVAGLLLVVGAAVAAVAGLVVAHRGAQAAADLAALAGATTLGRGGDACAASAGVAEHNGGVLTGCAVEGRDVVVTVSVEGPRLLAAWLDEAGGVTALRAEARAGPGP